MQDFQILQLIQTFIQIKRDYVLESETWGAMTKKQIESCLLECF